MVCAINSCSLLMLLPYQIFTRFKYFTSGKIKRHIDIYIDWTIYNLTTQDISSDHITHWWQYVNVYMCLALYNISFRNTLPTRNNTIESVCHPLLQKIYIRVFFPVFAEHCVFSSTFASLQQEIKMRLTHVSISNAFDIVIRYTDK